MFQSLIGILMNCNSAKWWIENQSLDVSIPNRDFDELQSIWRICDRSDSPVSIPNRDFDELQCVFAGAIALTFVFQSLIGILMNCNTLIGTGTCAKVFQSLIGILMNCNAPTLQGVIEKAEFQSLIGILMNCNLASSCATTAIFTFQSLIGILMNCNVKVGGPIRDTLVSIPNRDFDELQ